MAAAQAEGLFAEGVGHHSVGRVQEAAAAYAAACAADPDHLAARFNLAVALQALGRDAEAEAAYRAVLARNPGLVQALNNLANLLLAHDRVAEAMDTLVQATRAAPAFAPPWNNLGNALLRLGRPEEARAHFEQALARDPAFPEARQNLGRTLLTLGRPGEALAHLEAALAARPDDATLRFLRDAAAGARPGRPPDAYVAQLFDDMAAQFDAHLVERLGYRIPERIAAVLGGWLDARARPRRLLDLGCGTGLVAAALRGRYEAARGVDLASKMVERARSRGLYDDVQAGDLLATLAAQPAGSVDCLVAADVLVYVGDLAALFGDAARVLAPGGRFAFSVEGGGEGDDYALLPTGRYAHAAGYVRALAAAHALAVVHDSPETIRAERGAPVPGRLYVLAAPGAGPPARAGV